MFTNYSVQNLLPEITAPLATEVTEEHGALNEVPHERNNLYNS